MLEVVYVKLLRYWGLGTSLLLVAAVNAAVAAWAVGLDRHQPAAAPRTESSATVRRGGARGSDLVLVVALAGGEVSLCAVYVALAILGAAAIVLAPQPKTSAGVLAVFSALLGATLIYRWLDPAGAVFWTHHGVDFAVSGLFMFAPPC